MAHLDPALKANLTELIEIAREIGADGIWTLRGAREVTLTWTVQDSGGAAPAALSLTEAETVVIIRFAASDGGETGLEVH